MCFAREIGELVKKEETDFTTEDTEKNKTHREHRVSLLFYPKSPPKYIITQSTQRAQRHNPPYLN